MKSTSIKKIVSCTLAIMVLITSTFSLGATVTVNALDYSRFNSIKKVTNKNKFKQVKVNLKLSDIPKDF